MRQNFRNFLTHGGLFPVLKFNFQTIFWALRQTELKIGVMKGVHSFEQFAFSLSIAKALIRILRCQASLIEDLFDDEYDFILTTRFQSDPLERRFGQYRQMSGGRFLVGLKDSIKLC